MLKVTVPILSLDSVDSTMAEAERQAAAGRRGPLVVWARAQTGGLGRHGRQWVSPAGNLYWTILLDDPADRPRDAALAFAAGLAVIDAVAASGVDRHRLRVKWPNDVLLDGRKLAGLLVQASVGVGHGHVVIGIGVNVGSAPRETAYPATCLAEILQPTPDLEDLRDALTAAFIVRRRAWHRDGLGPLRDEVAGCLHGVGETIHVALDRDRTQRITGINEGLDPSGALLLRMADGAHRRLVAGDVLA